MRGDDFSFAEEKIRNVDNNSSGANKRDTSLSTVQKWLNELCSELRERLLRDLEQNKRIARSLTLHASAYKLIDSESVKKFLKVWDCQDSRRCPQPISCWAAWICWGIPCEDERNQASCVGNNRSLCLSK
ncbi:uncharacterized protein LOC130988194 [Salvia miltiorrhiza]|uniref:uncharacterized protein LOC130988194 n=1 Tax=Salvia miltiorrhiza TaxID=226208 RepID=UPI0025AD5D33|nr:uncharacterized protein LOC130988194 [Salvia miltiorrhiza]